MPALQGSETVIRRRNVKSRRRRDGLIRFAKDNTSQNGEDGIIERIFQILDSAELRWCVDVGAWDGKHLSNTHSLLVSPDEESSASWSGVLIEANMDRFEELSLLHKKFHNICVCRTVSCIENDTNSLPNILKPLIEQRSPRSKSLPKEFDFLCIDIDGSDYWVLHDLLVEGSFRPKVVCIEFNPTMPDDLVYVPSRSDTIRHGASLSALVELAEGFGYKLIETTLYNAFFMQQRLYEAHFLDEVPDASIEALHESTMGTSLYQLYDGTIKLWGCKKLLWHRIAMDESKMQVIAPDNRKFPFAPVAQTPFDSSCVVDLSSFFQPVDDIDSGNLRRQCSSLLLRQLREDGFCLVRGIQTSREICEQALHATFNFLQQADEMVRRTCLAKDRARRGYSPINVENFASLIGEQGPNDLVRKFRVGPLQVSNPNGALLQPNVWPSADSWDESHAMSFRSAVEQFYESVCRAGQPLIGAICEGLLEEFPELKRSLSSLTTVNVSHSSILTLLSYRVGSRHKGKNKSPLVAAHTDVGVITILLCDGGNCATLQRSDRKGGWVNVCLPESLPDDPIFIVNIADCFSDLSGGRLPSTLHRVVALPGSTSRNCCALFVGLDPRAELEVGGLTMTYEEWRKQRIARAQNVMKGSVAST
jgi:isopenicillin N synthase-like dioxygenase